MKNWMWLIICVCVCMFQSGLSLFFFFFLFLFLKGMVLQDILYSFPFIKCSITIKAIAFIVVSKVAIGISVSM